MRQMENMSRIAGERAAPRMPGISLSAILSQSRFRLIPMIVVLVSFP